MKKYEQEYPALKHENLRYRRDHKRAWGDARYFPIEDMQNFWDRVFDGENPIDRPKVR